MKVERSRLIWLAEASRNYQLEMLKIDQLDNLSDIGRLQGKIFKTKMMSPDRLKGSASLLTAMTLYTKMSALSLLVGTNPVIAACIGLTVYGMRSLHKTNEIQSIEIGDDGRLSL